MSEIRKEVPTGTIDGVNKIFILSNTPEFIDDIFLDGAIYTSFSLIWNQLTLTDAPTLSLFVDYQTAITTVQTDTEVTWGNVKTEIWDNLWQTANSTNFSSSRLNTEMNSLVWDIYRGRVINVLTRKEYRAWSLWFINGATRFRYIPSVKLTVALTLWDTEASMETANLDNSWQVLIWWDIIFYTSKTATQIEWITGQTINHLITDVVLPLYKMPDEMDKANWLEFVIKNTDNKRLPLPLDNTDTFFRYYQLLRVWNDKYIKAIWLDLDQIVEVSYIKKHSNITDEATVFPIMDLYWLSVVANIISWKLWYGKWIPNSKEQLMLWYTNLQVMFQNYTNEENVIKQSIKPIPYRMKSIRR